MNDTIKERIVGLIGQAYKLGQAVAIREYAVWNDGEQYVGVMRRPLHQVLNELGERSDEEMARQTGINVDDFLAP